MKSVLISAAFVLAAPAVLAQSPIYGQCGGQGWTGPTTCASGTVCKYSNPYYSQCLPGTSSAPPATSTPPPVTTTPPPVTTTPPPVTTTPPPVTTSPPPATTTGPVNANSINSKFKSHGKLYWGTCSDSNRFNNQQDATITTTDFGQVTPENSMKWDTVEANQGQFSFSGSDALVNFGTQNNLLVRGHTFVWAQQTPQWVFNLNATAMEAALRNHITTVMTRYKGKIYSYDVVNEHIEENGTVKSTPWTQKLGNNVFTIAFQAARAADPNAKLYINDYNLDSNNAKVQGIVSLVKQLNGNGTKLVDGIGSQAHITGGQGATALQALTTLASAGVEVAVTELDIANAPTTDYVQVAQACLQVSACVGVTSWGVRDPDSWRASTNPLLFDANFNPKPAYTAILNAL